MTIKKVKMKMKNPYWYKLIKLLKKEGQITTGLTIPYLYGAYHILGSPFNNIEELILEILNSNIDKYPIIQKCYEIHQHVVMVERKDLCHKEYSKFIKFMNENENNYLYISSNTDLGKTFKKICFNLEQQYNNPIQNEKFSWSKSRNDWQRFSEKEIALIMSIK